jgi:ribosomal-protein-alanine N-acetyltransferase
VVDYVERSLMVIEKAAETLGPITIQRMQIGDVEDVAKLDARCFPTPWSAGAYYTEIHNPSAYYIVAKTGGKIVGFAGEWLIMDEAHITTIGVAPECRGKKIGERILMNLLEEAIHRGVRRATLEVRRTNTVAQNLYTKYGFHTVAIRKGYYTNNNEDALVMWVDDMWSHEFLKAFRKYKEVLGDTHEYPGDRD